MNEFSSVSLQELFDAAVRTTAARSVWADNEKRETRVMSRLEDAKASLRRLEAEIAQLERFGDGERFNDGDVIRFTKTYNSAQVKGTYTYAALKTSRGWYVTGRSYSKDVYTYDELIELITCSPCATDIQVSTTWQDVVQPVTDK